MTTADVDDVDDNNFVILAYGVGDDLLNPDAPQALLSDIISNALPQPMMKDGKMNNELSVSSITQRACRCYERLVVNFSTFQKYYKTEAQKALNQRAPAA